jgi:hypothetical protein
VHCPCCVFVVCRRSAPVSLNCTSVSLVKKLLPACNIRFYQPFKIAQNTMTSVWQPKRIDRFCWTVVSSHCRRSILAVAAAPRATKDYTVKRSDCARSASRCSRTWVIYPTVSLLRIFATLCISDHCDTERSFSALKCIKNYCGQLWVKRG